MLKELYERQSIRKYLDKPVEEEKIMELLRAAMNAPTARNTQSWRFMVIENREALDHMQTLSPYTGMMKTAPCAIMVLGDKRDIEPEEYLYVNAAAAIENMLIEAVHQGLGTCFTSRSPLFLPAAITSCRRGACRSGRPRCAPGCRWNRRRCKQPGSWSGTWAASSARRCRPGRTACCGPSTWRWSSGKCSSAHG